MLVFRILVLCLAATNLSFGQSPSTVRWQFSSQRISPHEGLLVLKASVLPGWHLYSQHLPEGGPAPTRFYFDTREGYQLKDSTAEKGEAVTFYDGTYEMEITWYSGSVTFMQKIVVEQRPITIRGRIEYMTCNTRVCQAFEEPFVIVVK